MAKKRSRRRKKIKTEKKVAKAPVNQKLIVGVLIILVLIGGKYLFSQSKNADIKGTDITEDQSSVIGLYEVLNRPNAHEPGKVKIVEFMSFYCHQCYNFNRLKLQLESKYAGKVEIETLPIYWGDGSIKPGEAYLIAKDLGKGEEMENAIFKANFEEGRKIGSEEFLIEIAESIGLGNEFATKLKSGEAESGAKENLRLAGTYGVEETPTLIVDGNIKVTPHETGDDVAKMAENLDKIIEGLLEQ